ncbi:ABC transporter permease [Actinocatenispora comari]|uniref:Glycine/betaine ABC transporter permease n=1 Tax=Actinocatenispora comari TaxID=2807577 RepID=A0A8J4ACC6_9ACTN|nr:proline/glycine betaine ABC transporter permease [Actinocatenispora comari]GIL28769.1 glycine/betaine ABC transporter permease [Actinocatenispora comari]
MSLHNLATSGPSIPQIPIGSWADHLVTWLKFNIGVLFDGIKSVVETVVSGLSDALIAVPWPVMILIFILLGLWLRTWKFAIFALLGPLLIVSMQLWDDAMKTLALVIVAAAVSLILAIPIGIAAAQSAWVSRIVKPILDLMQTMPQFVYLIPAVILLGLGPAPGLVATVVFAMPPGVRFTELGIRQVNHEVVEAGEAFGASPWKVLLRIKLPLSLGTMMAGVNQVIMLTLSMVVIAGMLSAPGLGQDVVGAVSQTDVAGGFQSGLAVVILAIVLDRLTAGLGERAAPEARLARRARALKRRQAKGRNANTDAGQAAKVNA